MGESANLAFYAVVFAKGNVPKAKLDEALHRAVTTGAPLEAALVQSGALRPADCDGLLKIREQLGRVCQSCEGVTYLLQDQTEGNTPCEYCGGRLLTREQQRARDAAKAPPPRPEPTRRPPPPVRRPSEPTPSSSQRPAPQPAPGRGMPTQRLAPAPGPSLEPKLTQLELQLGALARELIEERQARAQMGQLVNTTAARAARVDELAAGLKAVSDALAATRDASAGQPDPAERALAALQERLGVDDVGMLPGRIAEQVAPRVLQAVRDRLGLDELSDLPARIAAEVQAQQQQQAARPAAPGVDEEALAARVAERVQAAAPSSAPVDVDALLARAVDEAARRAVEAVEARMAALSPAPDPRPDPGEEAALVERVLEAVAARLPGADPEALEERITRRALDAVAERLDRQQDAAGAADVAEAAARRAADEAVERARALVDEARERDAAARAAAQEGLAALTARVDALAAEARRAGPDDLAGQVTRAVEDAVLARLDERLAASAAALGKAQNEAVGDAEARLARATSEVLEALSARVEELAAAPRGAAPAGPAAPGEGVEALAREAAERAVKEAIDRLDDPRELIQRATGQLTRGLDERVAALRAEVVEAARAEVSRAAPAAAPAPAGGAVAPEALAALEARVSLIAGELKESLETLDARIAALRERTGRATRPEKQEQQDEALVARAVTATTAALEDRLAALEARPTASGAPAPGGAEAADEGAVVQRAVQAVWDQLAPLDLPGLPARVAEQVLASVTKKLDADMSNLVDTIAQEATAPVLRSIEARLEKLDLKNLPAKITRDVSAQVRAALGDDEALTEALAERVAARVGARAELRSEDAERRGARDVDTSTPLAPEVEQLVDRAAARALEWVEDRLTALERGGGIELEMARAAARAVASEVVEQRLREQAAHPQPGDFDGGKTLVADPNKSGSFERGGEPKTGVFDKKFFALAREVKNLKDAVDELQAGGGARPTGGASPELVNLLASPEFKQVFDAKVKEVLNYIKGDLVPSAVKRALQAEGSA